MGLRRLAAGGRCCLSVSEGRVFAESLESRQLLSTTYYVSPAGNDAATGTSPQAAFRSVARVNALDLQPGDQVLFEGGKTFALPAGSGAEKAVNAFGSNGARTLSGTAKRITHTLTGVQPGKAYTVKFRVGVDNPTDGRATGGVWFYKNGVRVGGVAFKLRNTTTFDRVRDFVAPPDFDRAEVFVDKESGGSVVRLQSTSVRESATPLTIDKNDAGTPEAPVVIGSYGAGRAIISAGNATGISVNDAGGVAIRNLVVDGSWDAATAVGRQRRLGHRVRLARGQPRQAPLRPRRERRRQRLQVDRHPLRGPRRQGGLRRHPHHRRRRPPQRRQRHQPDPHAGGDELRVRLQRRLHRARRDVREHRDARQEPAQRQRHRDRGQRPRRRRALRRPPQRPLQPRQRRRPGRVPQRQLQRRHAPVQRELRQQQRQRHARTAAGWTSTAA